jgi:hypothetical protein
MHQQEGFKFCLDAINNRALPLDLACPEHLSVWSPASLPYYFSILARIKSQNKHWSTFMSLSHKNLMGPRTGSARPLQPGFVINYTESGVSGR